MVRRDARMLRECEVKGKLARFLAGMRALERQHTTSTTARSGSGSGATGQSGAPPLPPMLAEFVVWAGDLLADEERTGVSSSSAASARSGGVGDAAGGGGRASARRHAAGEHSSVDELARRYLGSSSSGGAPPTSSSTTSASSAAAAISPDDEEELCSICQDGLSNTATCDELGEALETACGHRFHASCYARLMESTDDRSPVCPMCRASNISVRFS